MDLGQGNCNYVPSQPNFSLYTVFRIRKVITSGGTVADDKKHLWFVNHHSYYT